MLPGLWGESHRGDGATRERPSTSAAPPFLSCPWSTELTSHAQGDRLAKVDLFSPFLSQRVFLVMFQHQG